MAVQFILSILGLVAAGLLVLVLAIWVIVRLANRRPVGKALPVAVLVLAGILGAASAYGLADATIQATARAKDALDDAANTISAEVQTLLSQAVEFGTVGVLEGFGRSADHFEDKWRAESLSQAQMLRPRVLKAELTGGRLTLVLAIENISGEPIDLGQVCLDQHLVLQNGQSLCYPLLPVATENVDLPAGKTSVRQIDVQLPDGFTPTSLRTPQGTYPLWPNGSPSGA